MLIKTFNFGMLFGDILFERALRLMEDKFYVFGTPCSGKTNLNSNIIVPLHAIVFIEQSIENHINHLNSKEAIKKLIHQSLRPQDDIEKIDKLLELLDCLIKRNPIYQMGCNISTDAVKLVYETIAKPQ